MREDCPICKGRGIIIVPDIATIEPGIELDISECPPTIKTHEEVCPICVKGRLAILRQELRKVNE
jgi:hypothetical protein